MRVFSTVHKGQVSYIQNVPSDEERTGIDKDSSEPKMTRPKNKLLEGNTSTLSAKVARSED